MAKKKASPDSLDHGLVLLLGDKGITLEGIGDDTPAPGDDK